MSHHSSAQTTPETPQNVHVMQVLQDEPHESVNDDTVFLKGEVQPVEYRDVYFGIAFVVHLVAVGVTAVVLGPQAFAGKDEEESTRVLENDAAEDPTFGRKLLLWFAGMCVVSMAVLIGTLYLVMRFSRHMVHLSFFSFPILLVFFAVVSVLDRESRANSLPTFYLVTAAVFSAISACFYLCFRRFMPFAAANIQTALTAFGANKGLMLVSLSNTVVSFIWIIVWSAAFLGVFGYVRTHSPRQPCPKDYETTYEEDTNSDGLCDATPNAGVVVLFLLSLYWTSQVIRNVLHTTTAGTIGSWWVTDPALSHHSFWGFAHIGGSFYRAMTYSFGSICLGSLLVAILQTLESLLRSQRRSRRGSAILLCILECLAHIFRRWLEYFNSWAFCYVGLYGYDYVTAGRNVCNLFKTQGWTTFIADRLAFRVLFMCQFSIALMTGFASTIVDQVVGSVFGKIMVDDEETKDGAMIISHIITFTMGFFLGLLLASTALMVVESAIRTVIVCFAEQGAEFRAHHPALSEEMEQSWSATYPEEWSMRREARVVVAMTVVPTGGDSSANYPEANAELIKKDTEEAVGLL